MSMVSKLKFATRYNIEQGLLRYSEILAIDSMIYSNITYCMSDEKFAVLMPDGAAFCPIHETPILANKVVIPEIRAEILSVFEEWRPIYEKRKSV